MPDSDPPASSHRAAVDIETLVDRAKALVDGGRRAILGIAGMPGSGKSFFAEGLAALLAASPPADVSHPDWVACVPMDGFHLADSQLSGLRRRSRKGAPDTFDAYGYAALLQRIASDPEASEVIYAPTFNRESDEPIAGSIAVDRNARLIITEGNYLLLPDPPWSLARSYLAEVWFCDTAESRRMNQLVQRHIDFGMSREAARDWAHTTDQANALRIAAERHRADLVVPDSTLLVIGAPL